MWWVHHLKSHGHHRAGIHTESRSIDSLKLTFSLFSWWLFTDATIVSHLFLTTNLAKICWIYVQPPFPVWQLLTRKHFLRPSQQDFDGFQPPGLVAKEGLDISMLISKNIESLLLSHVLTPFPLRCRKRVDCFLQSCGGTLVSQNHSCQWMILCVYTPRKLALHDFSFLKWWFSGEAC